MSSYMRLHFRQKIYAIIYHLWCRHVDTKATDDYKVVKQVTLSKLTDWSFVIDGEHWPKVEEILSRRLKATEGKHFE